MIMNSSDVYSNWKEINELIPYSCDSLGTSGCATQSVVFVNEYNGVRVSQGTWAFKLSVNKEAGNEEIASIDRGFL
jgi:hypothetical protein